MLYSHRCMYFDIDNQIEELYLYQFRFLFVDKHCIFHPSWCLFTNIFSLNMFTSNISSRNGYLLIYIASLLNLNQVQSINDPFSLLIRITSFPDAIKATLNLISFDNETFKNSLLWDFAAPNFCSVHSPKV